MSGAGTDGGGGGVVRQGHLRKLKTMKRRYFVLRGETALGSARLEYYESEKKFRSGAAPRRSILLKSCFNINRRLDLKQRHVIALYTKEECFCVLPEGEEDLRAWLADLIKLHRADDTDDELLHPTQHIWQVNVQKKGLGASKNIIGLYNLCLTDKTLTLVKIKSNNNVIYDSTIPERVEFSLKNIRRCGDSECFFYMEVGRLTSTGAGELWMHTDDANIAQSMHSTIYHAMSNCTRDETSFPPHRNRSASATEDPRTSSLPPKMQAYCEFKGRGTSTEKGLCMSSCIRQCVCASGTNSIECSGAAIAPMSPRPAAAVNENQQPNNTLINEPKDQPKFKHHRTISLPADCMQFQEPLRICHERTRSAPLTGDEVDHAAIDKVARHSSCKAVNGIDFTKKHQWPRRASIGAKLTKLSPAHTKNSLSVIRNRCDSMPSRACPREMEPDGTPATHVIENKEGGEPSRDETDSAEWHKTPRIPEEPDAAYFEMTPGGVIDDKFTKTELMMDDNTQTEDYLPMGPDVVAQQVQQQLVHQPLDCGYMDVQRTLSPAASSGSVCSGTPSTDPRFSEYNLERAVSHIQPDEEERPPRAYSVGSRPAAAVRPAAEARMRAYSVGARTKHTPHHHHTVTHHTTGKTSSSAPLLPGGSADDLMVLDFSNNSPKTKPAVVRTPPNVNFASSAVRVVTPRYVTKASLTGSVSANFSNGKSTTLFGNKSFTSAGISGVGANMDEYVDMSPSGGKTGAGLEVPSFMTTSSVVDHASSPPLSAVTALSESPPASSALAALSCSPPANVATTPEGYVEMNYCVRRTQCEPAPSRPISIAADKPRPAAAASIETTHSPTSASPPTVTSPCTPSEGVARSTHFGSRDAITPLGSQTIFPLSLESPATPPRSVVDERQESEHFDSPYEGVISHSLSTVCEAADEGPTRSPEIGSPPHYVTLMNRGSGTRIASRPIAAPPKLLLRDTGELSCNPTANKTLARPPDAPLSPSPVATVIRAGPVAAPARFSLIDEPSRKSTSPAPPVSPKTAGAGSEAVQLNYAALDLEPRATSTTATPRTYTQIDFARSEKLNTADAN